MDYLKLIRTTKNKVVMKTNITHLCYGRLSIGNNITHTYSVDKIREIKECCKMGDIKFKYIDKTKPFFKRNAKTIAIVSVLTIVGYLLKDKIKELSECVLRRFKKEMDANEDK